MTLDEAISREEAILQIQRYGVGCLDSDDFTPETCERFVIDLLKKLPQVCTRKKSQWEYVADGATNGDVIKAIFPNVECREDRLGNVFVISDAQLGYIVFRESWWNAPYKMEGEE